MGSGNVALGDRVRALEYALRRLCDDLMMQQIDLTLAIDDLKKEADIADPKLGIALKRAAQILDPAQCMPD